MDARISALVKGMVLHGVRLAMFVNVSALVASCSVILQVALLAMFFCMFVDFAYTVLSHQVSFAAVGQSFHYEVRNRVRCECLCLAAMF